MMLRQPAGFILTLKKKKVKSKWFRGTFPLNIQHTCTIRMEDVQLRPRLASKFCRKFGWVKEAFWSGVEWSMAMSAGEARVLMQALLSDWRQVRRSASCAGGKRPHPPTYTDPGREETQDGENREAYWPTRPLVEYQLFIGCSS